MGITLAENRVDLLGDRLYIEDRGVTIDEIEWGVAFGEALQPSVSAQEGVRRFEVLRVVAFSTSPPLRSVPPFRPRAARGAKKNCVAFR